MGVRPLRRDGIAFQDDYPLLGGGTVDDLRYQPFDEVFAEHRTIAVPAGTRPGEHAIVIGLVDPTSGTRVRVDTDLPAVRRSVQLPVRLTAR